MYREKTLDELVKYLDELPFNKTVYIAEDVEEECSWWSMTKLEIADSHALYLNYCGGGSPMVVSMEQEDVRNGFFKAGLRTTLYELAFDTENKFLIDDEEVTKYMSDEWVERVSAILYDMVEDENMLIKYPTLDDWLALYKNDRDRGRSGIRVDVKNIIGEYAIKHDLDLETVSDMFKRKLENKWFACEWNDKIAKWIEEGIKEYAVRTDWKKALNEHTVNNVTDLSDIIDYGFRGRDLSELARLHKEGNKSIKDKIEALLTDCNYHKECGDFLNGKYGEYIKTNKSKEEQR